MNFKKIIIFFLILVAFNINAQEYEEIIVESTITDVQPMTGIVFWDGDNTNTDAISLEFSYMLFQDVVDLDGNFVWDKVEDKLNDISSRNHQAIFRFRYAYVGEETSVPQYIKNLSDYHETKGKSEGETTWFPDWTHPELSDFTIRFYTAFAEKYDADPRLAFIQVGFGLWGEYHIYDGPFVLGKTFPSKAFQIEFFNHLDTIFQYKPWSISIDAADDTYSPFENHPNLLNIQFGLFDDSFMHKDHAGYNTESWNFFDRTRFKISPAGGEFSYYTDYDQEHVLDVPNGPHGIVYEDAAAEFHITYMIGNDQPDYQTMDRIKDASFASGYKFRIKSFKTNVTSSIVEVENIGIAPFYYPAYITVNGVRSQESLQYLDPGGFKSFTVEAGGDNPVLTIESDFILEGQSIDFYGTTYSTGTDEIYHSKFAKIYPNCVQSGATLFIDVDGDSVASELIDLYGRTVFVSNEKIIQIPNLENGVYFLNIELNGKIQIEKIIVL